MLRAVSTWQFAPGKNAPAGVWETYAFAPCAKHFATNTQPYIIYMFLNEKSGLCLSAPSCAAQATARQRDSCEKLGAWRSTRLDRGDHRPPFMQACENPTFDPRAPEEICSASALSSGVIGVVDSRGQANVI